MKNLASLSAAAKHTEKKDSYRSELAAPNRAGGDAPVMIGCAGDSSARIARRSLVEPRRIARGTGTASAGWPSSRNKENPT